jgi:hypothetical protein
MFGILYQGETEGKEGDVVAFYGVQPVIIYY